MPENEETQVKEPEAITPEPEELTPEDIGEAALQEHLDAVKSEEKTANKEEEKEEEPKEPEKSEEKEPEGKEEEKPDEKVTPDKSEGTDDDPKPEEEESPKEVAGESEPKGDEKKAEVDYEELAKVHAFNKGLTLEKAREDITKIKNTREKYGDDSQKMAEAVWHSTNQVTQLTEELNQHRQQMQNLTAFGENQTVVNGQTFTDEKLISEFRGMEPKKTEDMEDDRVLAEAKYFIKTTLNNNLQAQNQLNKDKLDITAEKKRVSIQNSIPEEYKAFTQEIMQGVNLTKAEALVHESFDIKNIITWAKGGHYDADKKAAYEEGFKKGKESANIQSITPSVGISGTKKTVDVKKKLTKAQEQDAIEMFPDSKTVEEAIQLYFECGADKYLEA